MNDGGDSLAPVIPLFGGPPPQPSVRMTAGTPTWNDTWGSAGADNHHENSADDAHDDDGAAVARENAEKSLLRKLRTRSLSIREARSVLSERGLPPEDTDVVIDVFLRRGYLDDRALAEQLVHAGVDRKGQGRKAISQTLAKRGITRDVVDAVIAALPDDDADRALEFARTKARSMGDLDQETALRRLAGQLARRGYGGSAAFAAARAALDEVVQTRSPGVTFRES